MELCPKGFGAISQLFSDSVSEAKTGGWHVFGPPVQRPEVICPVPCRANRIPFMVDDLYGLCCKSKDSNVHRGESELEIIDILLNKDDIDFDSDIWNKDGIFHGSPPVRSSNPMIRDVEFIKRNYKSMGSPLGSTPGGKVTSPRVDRGVPCGSTGKPKVRTEGFNSGNSKSGCVVSARA